METELSFRVFDAHQIAEVIDRIALLVADFSDRAGSSDRFFNQLRPIVIEARVTASTTGWVPACFGETYSRGWCSLRRAPVKLVAWPREIDAVPMSAGLKAVFTGPVRRNL